MIVFLDKTLISLDKGVFKFLFKILFMFIEVNTLPFIVNIPHINPISFQ